MESAEPKQKPPGGQERLLLEENYFSLMLFGLFNPVVDSIRFYRMGYAQLDEVIALLAPTPPAA